MMNFKQINFLMQQLFLLPFTLQLLTHFLQLPLHLLNLLFILVGVIGLAVSGCKILIVLVVFFGLFFLGLLIWFGL